MPILAVMPNYDVSCAHDSSLDDAGLLRRCEHRIATYPKSEHNFSFSSNDTSLSNALLTPPATVFDVSEEVKSDNSFQTPTDKRDSTFYENTSLNRNPCPDTSRRWAEQRDCSCVTHCKSLQQNANTQQHQKFSGFAQDKSKPHLYCTHKCALSGNQECAPSTHQKADMTSSISSTSSPIVDNLILESEANVKHGCCDKTYTQRGKVVRCPESGIVVRRPENEAQTFKMSIARDASAHDYDIRKQRTIAYKQQFNAKSFQNNKERLDPSSDNYLKRLDSVVERMSQKSDRQPSKVPEKGHKSVSAKKMFSNPLNKSRISSPGRRSCNCPCRFSANSKLNPNGVSNEAKYANHVRSRSGVKQDVIKVENNAPVSRSAPRTRCSRTDKRRHACWSESAGRDQVRLPNVPRDKLISSSKKRSKSLSALPRCQFHETASISAASNRGSVKFNICATTDNKRHGTFSYDPAGLLSKQQLEILKHIPGDITPDETGTLLQTVLSIMEQRQCMKCCAHGDVDSRNDLHGGTERIPDVLSKYQPQLFSDSSCTFTSLSPKSKISYFDRHSQTLGGISPVPISHSSQSPDKGADNSPTDEHRQLENTFLNPVAKIKEPTSSKVNIAEREPLITGHLSQMKLNDTASRCGGLSSQRPALSPSTSDQTTAHKTDQSTKKSAIVLPYEDNFTTQERQPQGEMGAQQSSSHHVLTPISSDISEHNQHSEGHQIGLSGETGNSRSASSRHIEWKYHLPSRKDSHAAASEFVETGVCNLSPGTNQSTLGRFDSCLSDGFLYCKPTKLPRRTPHHVGSHKDCPTSAVVPGASREAIIAPEYQRCGGKSNSDTSRLIGPGISGEHNLFLLPCPHGSGQGGQTYQRGTNLDQEPESRETELDKVINDLRAEIRSTYAIPDVKRSAMTSTPMLINGNLSEAKCVTSHSRGVRFEQNQIVTRAMTQHQSEATYLNNASCSADAMLTNASFSNRSLGFDDFPCINRQHLRHGPSFNSSEESSSGLTFPFQSELHIKNQSASSNKVHQGTVDVWPGENMTSKSLTVRNQNRQRETPVLFRDYQRPVSGAVSDATREASSGSARRYVAVPSTISSNQVSCEDSSRVRDTGMLQESHRLAGRVLNYHDIDYNSCVVNQGRQVENIYGQSNKLLPVSFRNLESLEGSWPRENLESVSGLVKRLNSLLQSRSNGKPAGCIDSCNHVEPAGCIDSCNHVEPAGCVNPCNNAKSFVNMKSYNIPTTTQLPGSFQLLSNPEPLINAEPCNSPSQSTHSPGSLPMQNNNVPPNNSSPTIILKSPTQDNSLIYLQADKTSKSPCKFRSAPLNETMNTTPAIEQMLSPYLRTNPNNSELAKLKESTETLLAEVYRKYYTDLFAPNMERATISDLTNSLELLHNFSPISQVDVNTQYPLTIDTMQEQTSVESSEHRESGPDKSEIKISAKTTVIKMLNKKRTNYSKNKEISQDKNKMESTFSRPDVRLKNNPRTVSIDKNKQSSQTPKSKSNATRNNVYEKSLRKGQTKASDLRCPNTTDDILMSDTTEPVDATGPIVLDVTSLHKRDLCPVQQNEKTTGNGGTNINTRDLVVKTYTTGSAVPVNVKVISEINDRKVARLDNTTSLNRRSFNKAGQRFQTGTTKWAHVEKFSSDEPKWRHKEGVCPTREEPTSDRCQSCTVAYYNYVNASTAASARKKLTSSVKQGSKRVILDSSLTSESCDDTDYETNDVMPGCHAKGDNCNNCHSQDCRIVHLNKVRSLIVYQPVSKLILENPINHK